MIFFALKKLNKLEFESPSRLKQFLEGLPDCRLSVVIKQYRKSRSLDQNNLFHGLCRIIAEEVGHEDINEVKNGIKLKIGLWRYEQNLPIMISTARLNTEEMGKLIDATYRLAVDLNIKLPTPEEYKEML